MVRETRGKENVEKDRNVTDLTRIKFVKTRKGRNLIRDVEKEKVVIDLKIRRKAIKEGKGRK